MRFSPVSRDIDLCSRGILHDRYCAKLAGLAGAKLVEMREHGQYPGHSIARQMSQIVPGEIASYFCDKCGLRVTPAQLPYLERKDGALPTAYATRDLSAVRELGALIGFGNMMHLARDEWRTSLLKNDQAGGEFAVGCCVALTVPCGCTYPCDWCNGCGWITPKVKALRDAQRANTAKPKQPNPQG